MRLFCWQNPPRALFFISTQWRVKSGEPVRLFLCQFNCQHSFEGGGCPEGEEGSPRGRGRGSNGGKQCVGGSFIIKILKIFSIKLRRGKSSSALHGQRCQISRMRLTKHVLAEVQLSGLAALLHF